MSSQFQSQTTRDIIVIGGGPAGSTAAALLAKKGYDVLLAEKAVYPRFHIGESLLPGSWPTFYKLGVVEDLRATGQIIKTGTRFNLFDNATYEFGLANDAPEFFPDNQGQLNSFQVVRSEFDQILLTNACKAGVEVVQPSTVEQVLFEGERTTGVILKTEDGGRHLLNAKIIVDASGRDSLIARRLDLRHPDPKLTKVAYFAHFKGCYREHPSAVPFWAFAFKGGWVWYITLKDNITSIGVVLDLDLVKSRQGRDLWEFFFESVRRAPGTLNEWMAHAEPVGELHVISSLAYFSDRFAGDGWVLVGDAAMFVDPIFSSGVNLGMRGGDLASETIVTAFDRADFSRATLQPYDDKIRVPMRVIFPIIYRWYELLRDPDTAVDLFALSYRHSNLQRRMNATLGGAYEAVGEKFAL